MSIEINDLLKLMLEKECSDLHITVGSPPMYRKDGRLLPLNRLKENSDYLDLKYSDKATEHLTKSIIPKDKLEQLAKQGQIDFSYSLPGVGRFRVNAYKQRGCLSLAIRAVPIDIPSFHTLKLPGNISEFSRKPNGLVLVTGPTGSGKSTTLAALIDLINEERSCHIITLEDPIEYLHKHKNSIVNQRELGQDTNTFAGALRAALRQDPDVILVGEMRDLETIEVALKASETGHLVLATLHTNNAVQTIDRIIDVFPAAQQQQVRVQLSSVLRGIISQRLLPLVGGGRTAAIEIMLVNSAIRSLIREGKTHQIYSIIQTSAKEGMITYEKAVKNLLNEGKITPETAFLELPDDEEIKSMVQMNGGFI